MNSNSGIQHKIRPCPGRPKDAQKRGGIVAAARNLFLQQGYELTSMEAVAKLADVSKLTIYRHFDNKADLFREVIREGCERQVAPDNFSNYAGQPPEQALLQLGVSLVKLIFNPESLRLLRIIQAEALHHPQIVQVFYQAGPQRVKSAFAELLQVWVAQVRLAVADIPRACEQFFSLLKGEAHLKALLHQDAGLNDAEMAEHVHACVRLFLAGYGLNPTEAG